MGANCFNDMEIDAVGEIMNISLGASATAVSQMLGTKVDITTPQVKVLTIDEFEFKSLEPAIGVEISYTEGLEGKNIVMFRRNDVRIIVGMLMGGEIPEEEFELDEINISAICEVMNQMMGASATALSEFLSTTVNISTPKSFEIEDDDAFKRKYFTSDTSMVVVRFLLEIQDKLKSEFLNIMSIDLTKRLLEPFSSAISMMNDENTSSNQIEQESKEAEALSDVSSETQNAPAAEATQPMQETQAMAEPMEQPVIQSQPEPAVQPQPVAAVQPAPAVQPQPMAAAQPAPMAYPMSSDPMMLQLLAQMQQSQMQMMELMREMKAGEKSSAGKSSGTSDSGSSSIIRSMTPGRLEDAAGEGVEEAANQEMLMQVPLEVSVEIGRTKKLVRDILEFTQGSLVVLDKMAGEQVDLYVNGQVIARGDIVVVEDNFGIRITEIVSKEFNQESL